MKERYRLILFYSGHISFRDYRKHMHGVDKFIKLAKRNINKRKSYTGGGRYEDSH